MPYPGGSEECPSGLHCSRGQLQWHQAERVLEGSPSPSLELLLLVRAGREEGMVEWVGVYVGQNRNQVGCISDWRQAHVYLCLGVCY